MLSETKEPLELTEAEGDKESRFPKALEGAWSYQHLSCRLLASRLWENIFLLF